MLKFLILGKVEGLHVIIGRAEGFPRIENAILQPFEGLRNPSEG